MFIFLSGLFEWKTVEHYGSAQVDGAAVKRAVLYDGPFPSVKSLLDTITTRDLQSVLETDVLPWIRNARKELESSVERKSLVKFLGEIRVERPLWQYLLQTAIRDTDVGQEKANLLANAVANYAIPYLKGQLPLEKTSPLSNVSDRVVGGAGDAGAAEGVASGESGAVANDEWNVSELASAGGESSSSSSLSGAMIAVIVVASLLLVGAIVLIIVLCLRR